MDTKYNSDSGHRVVKKKSNCFHVQLVIQIALDRLKVLVRLYVFSLNENDEDYILS